MKNKNSVFGMFVTTLVFAGLLFMGLSKIDPRAAELSDFIIITGALLLFLWALIGTLMLAARKITKKDTPSIRLLTSKDEKAIDFALSRCL